MGTYGFLSSGWFERILLCVNMCDWGWRWGGGFAGGSLERSAKKAEYPGVGWNKWEKWGSVEGVQQGRTEEWKGFDLDGGYHNRLFYYFTPTPPPVWSLHPVSFIGARVGLPEKGQTRWLHCHMVSNLSVTLFYNNATHTHSPNTPFVSRRSVALAGPCPYAGGFRQKVRSPTTTSLPCAGRHG